MRFRHLPSPALLFAWLIVVFWNPSSNADEPGATLPDRVEFNRDIRPLLADRCFACHGPDKNKREADLRLDTREGLVGDATANDAAKSGAVKPGEPDASPLLQRIMSTNPDERMPPPAFGKDVSPEEQALLRRWIEQGAVWEGHWAFQPIRSSPSPNVDDPRFRRNFIDRYIRAELNKQGLEPSPREQPHTLVRRLSFDLLGLPPEQALVEKYSANPTDEAYEQLVDELLSSPHFGERMAVWWLDLVRYADSVGYHGDQPISVGPFRDYVIRSFNQNKPFDQFTIEQIAGDLLPESSEELQIAAGYNRLGMMSAEGGVQPKEYLAKYIAERVRNVSGAWLGVTYGCCECHDHKYDPFTSREFYQLEAFFADIQEQGLYDGNKPAEPFGPEMQVPSDEQRKQKEELVQKLAQVQQLLDTPTESLAQSQRTWEEQQLPWVLLKPEKVESLHKVKLEVQSDGSVLASGKNPDTDTYTVTIAQPPAGITAIRLEVLPHDSLPQKGPGRAGNGNFVLSEIELYRLTKASDLPAEQAANEPASASTPVAIGLKEPTATYEQTGAAGANPYGKWAVAAAVDKDEKGPTWGWAIMEQVGRPQNAVFQLADVAQGSGEGSLQIVLKQNLDNPKHTIGRFRLYAITTPQPVRADQSPPPEISALLQIARDQRTPEQNDQIAKHYRTIAPELAPQREQLAALQRDLDALNRQIPRTLVTKRVEPRVVRMLPRGNWMDESGEVVQPTIPVMLGGGTPPADRRLNRLDLAKWVVAAENPLTSRATVNRVWKLFFGAGLSRKLDDLGAQGEWPSHPQLLDALAIDFINSGWNIKHLVKQIVMSETYRQSSVASAQVAERDPYNRWLSHQSRWRLDAEFVRDNALTISDLLVKQVGGNSVKPYQPAGYWAYLNFPQREWQNGQGAELYRRGLYTHWQRQYLHPSLVAFDAPNREECTADRPRSNTPLQALVLLNDPTYVEAARVFAERAIRNGGSSPADRVQWMFVKAMNRQAKPVELERLVKIVEQHRSQYAQDTAARDQVLAIGAAPIDSAIDKQELAAWVSVARVLLNLHETITRN